jgi:hypothetical protein
MPGVVAAGTRLTFGHRLINLDVLTACDCVLDGITAAQLEESRWPWLMIRHGGRCSIGNLAVSTAELFIQYLEMSMYFFLRHVPTD